MNNRVGIAVIDDGVSRRNFPDLKFDISIGQHHTIQTNDSTHLPHSHGDVCAAIIKKYSPYSQLGSIQILNPNSKTGSCAALISAIHWCMENSIKIAHMSLGTIQPRDYDPLLKAVNTAYENGMIIVAACGNGLTHSYPASFSNVIGVKSDKSFVENQYRPLQYPHGGIDFAASARHMVLSSESLQQYETSASNSFAAPLITALVNNIVTEHPKCGFDEAKNILNRICGCDEAIDKSYKYIDYASSSILLGCKKIWMRKCPYGGVQSAFCDCVSDMSSKIIGIPSDILHYGKHALQTVVDTLGYYQKHPAFLFPHISSMQLDFSTVKRYYEIDALTYFRSDPTKDTLMPVVKLVGVTSSKTASVLAQKFRLDNFTPMLLSDDVSDFLEGFVYIHSLSTSWNQCLHMAEHGDADLILFSTRQQTIMQSDIMITCNESIWSIVGSHDTNPGEMHYGCIEDLYKSILKLLVD